MAAIRMAALSAYLVTRIRKQPDVGLTTSSKNTAESAVSHSTEAIDTCAN